MTFQTIARHVDEMLENQDWFSLNKLLKADLIALCQERGLATDGTKEALIQALMDWKLGMRPVPVPATPKLTAVEPKEPAKKAPVNSVQLSRMLIDDDDRAEIGEIAYEQLA
ncbi:hypothetical protein SYNPS1DRAFT_25719, partial [Syncephalis pseudoplumigaleata]